MFSLSQTPAAVKARAARQARAAALHAAPDAARPAAVLAVTRTNYDRYEGAAGRVFTGRELQAERARGLAVVVTDATPCDAGTWTLDPLS